MIKYYELNKITNKKKLINSSDIISVGKDYLIIRPSNSNAAAKIIYDYICVNGFITTPQILEITKITTTQGANVALGRLMKANLIEKIRKGRQFIYQLKCN